MDLDAILMMIFTVLMVIGTFIGLLIFSAKNDSK